MRIDVHAVQIDLTPEMRRHAETRLWLAARRWAHRVIWVGMWLVDHEPASEEHRIVCRVDCWVRGLGHLAVRHTDRDLHSAIDIATARLEQVIAREMRPLIHTPQRPAAADQPQDDIPLETDAQARPGSRLAVVIERRRLPGQVPLLSWLRHQYDIEQIARISLPPHLWESAANGPALADNLRERLDLSLLCWPQLIIVVGRAGAEDDEAAVRLEQQRVRRIVGQLAEWDLPVETMGLWVRQDPAGSLEAEELVRFVPGADRADDDRPRQPLHPSNEEMLSCH